MDAAERALVLCGYVGGALNPDNTVCWKTLEELFISDIRQAEQAARQDERRKVVEQVVGAVISFEGPDELVRVVRALAEEVTS